MKKIKLTQGKYAIVDNEDFDFLNQWKWYLGSHGYACRRPWDKTKKRYNTLLLHRIVNKTPDLIITDHINQNKLDNRKCNLRSVNKSINGINRGLQSNNTSGYKGISFDKRYNKWYVRIKKNNNDIYLGSYQSKQDAIYVREKAEKKYHLI